VAYILVNKVLRHNASKTIKFLKCSTDDFITIDKFCSTDKQGGRNPTVANKSYKTYACVLVLNFCAVTFRLQRLENMCVFKRIRFIAKRCGPGAKNHADNDEIYEYVRVTR